MKKYISAKEVAEMFEVKVDTVYHWVLLNKIPCIRRRGIRTRFDAAAIEKWADEGMSGPNVR